MEEQRPAGYNTDNEGNPSSMRVRSWWALAAAIFTEILAFIRPPEDFYFVIWFFTVWVAAAFVPQAISKFAEMMPTVWKK